MTDAFKTVLLLSCVGAVLIGIILVLKPLTVKKFPEKWQCAVWLTVALVTIVPLWRFFPAAGVPAVSNQSVTNTPVGQITDDFVVIFNKPIPQGTDTFDILAKIWLVGVCVFICVAILSYLRFLGGKRKESTLATDVSVFENVKAELKIKRKIPVRISDDTASPMLVGVFFPKIYLPKAPLDEETVRMIYRHELTHYKHKDLLIKWFMLFINAVHWFNPFVYLLSANLSESLEVSCDMSVTKNLSESEKKMYMNTILNLVEQKKG